MARWDRTEEQVSSGNSARAISRMAGREEVADRRLRFPNSQTGSAEASLEENLLLDGRTVPVLGDDSVHAASHERAISSERFRRATSRGQIALLLHLSQHLMRLSDGEPVIVEQSGYRPE